MNRKLIFIAAIIAALFVHHAHGRPIVYAHSTTVMADFSAGAMHEAAISYAPRHNWSFGLGHMMLESHTRGYYEDFNYARLNYLAKRWNRAASQANVWLWGGVGNSNLTDYVPETLIPGEPIPGDDHGHVDPTLVPGYWRERQAVSWHTGGQIDYETRRLYSALKSEYYTSRLFSHRVDTVQLGFAPYEHDVDSLATWFVVSGVRHTGGSHDETEWALLLRFFKKRAWLEAGSTTEGKLRANLMVSF